MLVLTRKRSERVQLKVTAADLDLLAEAGEDLVIDLAVVEVQRDRVKVGFEAPKEVHIIRNELLAGDQAA